MKYERALGIVVVLLLVLAAAGCGGGSSSSTTPPTPSVSVTISPTSTTVGYGGTEQFTATVTGSTNTAVTWSVSSSSSSSSTQIGTISTAGLYTAPMATSVASAGAPSNVSVTAGNTTPNVNIAVQPLNSVATVTVTATSQADASASASATVTLSGLSLIAIGQCTQSTTQANTLNCSGDGTGTEVSPGTSPYLFIAGYGILPGTSYSISGSDVTIPTQPSSAGGNFQTTTDGTPAVYFQINVSPTATPGPRNLVVTNTGNELTSFPGALQIK